MVVYFTTLSLFWKGKLNIPPTVRLKNTKDPERQNLTRAIIHSKRLWSKSQKNQIARKTNANGYSITNFAGL